MGKEEKKPTRDKPPRPRNAWMLFLCAYHDERKAMREPPLIDPETAKHTKIVSERWKNLPMSEKEKWHAKAEQEKEEHAARYPGYKYQPSKHKKQRTFYGGAKAQRKMQNLAQTAQAKIQQDIGGRLIWIDVAENGKSVAGPVELYDTPTHGIPPSSTVGVHPYDYVIASAPHSPIFLRPVAQYTGPPSERTNSLGPDSDEDDAYDSAPPESDWENDYVDEDEAELRTPGSATYPRRGSDPLRIVMTVQNRLGTLTEVDAGVSPSDPERPLSPPIPIMQLIRESRGVTKSTDGEPRCGRPSDHRSYQEAVRFTFLSDPQSGRERSYSTPTLYSSLSSSPRSAGSSVRSPRTPYPPTAARPCSSERSAGPPLASPLASPLSAQPHTQHEYWHPSQRRYRVYSTSPTRYATYRENAPHSAQPYYRPPDSKLYAHSARRPSGSAWLPPPGFSPSPARRPSWLPSSTRPGSPSIQFQTPVALSAAPPVHVKEEDMDEDVNMIDRLEDISAKPELEDDMDQLDEDQYPVHRPRLASDAAVEQSLRPMFQLAPIRSPPSPPKGDTRLPPIQIPRTPSPDSRLSPHSLPASAYLKGPAPGSLGLYSPQHAPTATAGSPLSHRFRPVLSAVSYGDLQERSVPRSPASSLATRTGLSHAPVRKHKAHPGGAYRYDRDKDTRSSSKHGIPDYTMYSGQERTPRMQSSIEPSSEPRSSPTIEAATDRPGADAFTLRPARF